MKRNFPLTLLALVFLCLSCEKDPELGSYTIDDDGTIVSEMEDGPMILREAVTDYDGNTYDAVEIGNQIWMKENLRTTHYADGTPIEMGQLYVSDLGKFWFYPNDDTVNKKSYGLLYSWKAVMGNANSSVSVPSGVQGICPAGWHVPSDEEWKQLEMTVGMTQSDADLAGDRGDIAARLSGNQGWMGSQMANAAGNQSAPNRNTTAFSALPAGTHHFISNCFGEMAAFWTATEDDYSYAYIRSLNYNRPGVYRYGHVDKATANSVRCVCD